MRTSDRTLGTAVAVVGAVVFALLAWLLVPWHGAPDTTGVDPRDWFAPADLARMESYSWWARLRSAAALGVHLAVVTAFLAAPVRAVLSRIMPSRWWLQAIAVVVVISAAARLATLPLAVWGQVHRRQVGLTQQGWGGWLRDLSVSFVLGTVITAAGVLVVLGLRRRWRRAWPLLAAACAAGAVVIGSWVYPLVVEPLYNDFHVLEAEPLRADVLGLAKREGVEVDQVLVADASRRTTSLNAYVSGIGNSRRVVLYDTLVESVPHDEVLSVVAHELAHARHHDVAVGTVLGAVGAAAATGLLGIFLSRRRSTGTAACAAALVVLTAWGGVAAAPVENGISRQIEMRADLDALKATGDPVAFRKIQQQLAVRSLADPDPPAVWQWWWGSHPTVVERIAGAQSPTARW